MATCGKDLQQEVVVPAGDFTLAFDAVPERVLLLHATSRDNSTIHQHGHDSSHTSVSAMLRVPKVIFQLFVKERHA